MDGGNFYDLAFCGGEKPARLAIALLGNVARLSECDVCLYLALF